MKEKCTEGLFEGESQDHSYEQPESTPERLSEGDLAAHEHEKVLCVGIDVGSTTAKLVAFDSLTGDVVRRVYRRHRARQVETVMDLVCELAEAFPERPLRIAVTGSGGADIARALGAPFVQEVVANATALQELYPDVRTAIELGGQDAKVLFFSPSETTGKLEVDDMRMNGTCAGGTGAFIDEIAALLNVPVEEFNSLAEQGENVYPVSGRCGVFAKTDMQPLVNQGVAKADLALSALHAIAKQTIGGLAQGRAIEPPVAFEGGPLLFNPKLVEVFTERLGLDRSAAIVPDDSETMVALGAALFLRRLPEQSAVSASWAQSRLEGLLARPHGERSAPPLFRSAVERARFCERHRPDPAPRGPRPGRTVAFLGIDSGSTTTKVALVDASGDVLDADYASNEGEPLGVARRMLVALRDRWIQAGAELVIAAVGVTGYGERMFAEAYQADCAVVETVAHARAALASHPEATFVLDIGGQDMKALWLDGGVITDIVVNEACSSGCGSFLEGFAASLGIPREAMADAAFSSASPADLGSRCTVFMESSVITAQRNGKRPEDIMAGLSRSIAENVLTKVIRSSNVEKLGPQVVVQGGTFANDAVLRAFEERLGRDVTRTRHPELAGAIGAALIAADRTCDAEGARRPSRFIGLDAVAALDFTREQNAVCPQCGNHCARTVLRFSSGATYVTGNRCPRGERVFEEPAAEERAADASNTGRSSAEASSRVEAAASRAGAGGSLPQYASNLFRDREQLLFQDWGSKALLPDNGIVIGLPRVLSLWDEAPFWLAFFRSLGFAVKVSRPSSRQRYEDSLFSVASDTACLPAKLAHSHVRDLAERGVSRIFMPIVTAVKLEGAAPHSESMCALVKGYPMVVRSSDAPEETWGIPFDTSLFHWHSIQDRERQLARYMDVTFAIAPELTRAAIEEGDHAKQQFKGALEARGEDVLSQVRASGSFAVVLAGRPYHNDPFVNHGLPELIAAQGIPVLPVDALPGLDQVRLDRSRLDIVNNYHVRMLRGAMYAAYTDCLEYAQIVSFGCGHDAYLSDEIVRLMGGMSRKAPLVLKLDEGDVRGPLEIRVRSFLETVAARRRRKDLPVGERRLNDPYPAKFRREDRPVKTVLVPNTSHAFARLMAAVFSKQGLRAVPLPVGREKAAALGKKYVHNDICYPAQMVIGEALEALESGAYDPDNTAIGMAKYLGDCRLTHYGALLRKALDDAGYPQVPIITNDDADESDMHPGFKMSIASALRVAFCLPMIDALEGLLRRMRPYEVVPGAAQSAFDRALDAVVEGVEAQGIAGARRGFKKAVKIMGEVSYDRSAPRPKVLIVGEYLLNFHPGANHEVERYLEDNGMEVVEARMTDVIRKTYFYQRAQVREYDVEKPLSDRAFLELADRAFEVAHDVTDRIGQAHPLYEAPCRMPELVEASDPIVHHTFDAGEGVLIPAEILHHYAKGVRAFVILQPFGCLPNHIVGRGIAKRLREECPGARLLVLDYDPDASFANIENRLQMLIMSTQDASAGYSSEA